MADTQVRADEARRNLRGILDEVARGAHVTILRYDTPAAVVVPVEWHEKATAALEATG